MLDINSLTHSMLFSSVQQHFPIDNLQEEQSRTMSICAFIYGDNTIEEAWGKNTLQWFKTYPEFTDLAVNFLHSDHTQLRCMHVEDAKSWCLISMIPERARFPKPRVIVTCQHIEPPYGLSLRELDVLTLLSAGLCNPDIGRYLFISPKTVAKHVENIFVKLQTQNRFHASLLASKQGLIRYPTPGKCQEGYSTIINLELQATHQDKKQDYVLPARCLLAPRPILIGIPLPLSGIGSSDGAEMLNGSAVAVHEINARGGIHGRPVKIFVTNYDIQDPFSIKAAYSDLINHEVDAISAGYSCVQKKIHTMVGDYGAPYLHAATLEDVVNEVRNCPTELGNIFQTCASDVKYGPGMARFITKLSVASAWQPIKKHITVLIPPWANLDIGLTETERILDRHGFSIDILSSIAIEKKDWVGVCQELQRSSPGVVMLASYLAEDGIAFQEAFSDNPFPALIYMLYNPSAACFCSTLDAKAEGVIWATTSGIYTDHMGMNFRHSYAQIFGTPPGESHAGLAYDRVHILANTWARANNPRQFDKVINDLRSTVYRGVNGAYFFGNAGQAALSFPDDTKDMSISKAQLIFQIQAGRHRILSPTPYNDGKFILPPWFKTLK